MIALQDLILETSNIFESEDIKQLEKERMRLYMKVRNWKKSGKDTSELEIQLNDIKKRLSDAKRAAKGAVVTPQQTTPTGDDSVFGKLGTDGFGVLDIDSIIDNATEDILMRNKIKQYILDNYYIKEKVYDAGVEVVKQKNGEYIVNYGSSKTKSGLTIALPKLYLQESATSLTGGLFKWGEVRYLICNNSNISTLKGAPEKCYKIYCTQCPNLISLEGAPRECNDFCCQNCPKLKSLKGAPEKCDNFQCIDCTSLIDLTGGPKESNKYSCSDCKKLKSLKGAPKESKFFDCSGCSKLSSLEGMPDKCTVIDCESSGIKDLTGTAPSVTIINISNCKKITSLKGCPANLKSLLANDCKNLTDATDLPNNAAVSGRNTPALKSMQQTIFM